MPDFKEQARKCGQGCLNLRHNTRGKVIVYCAVYFLLGAVVAILGPTLPSFGEDFNTTAADLNFVFLFRGGGWTGSSFLAGYLFDRFAGHRLMSAAMGLLALTLGLVPVAAMVSKWLWAVVFTFVGVGGAFVDVGINTMIAWLFGEHVGPYVQLMHFSFGIGACLTPIWAAEVLSWGGNSVSWVYWMFTILAVPVALVVLAMPSPEHPSAEHVESSRSLASLEEGVGGGDAVGADGGDSVPAKRMKRTVPKYMNVLLTGLLMMFCGLEVGYGSWVYSYSLDRGLADEISGAYLNAVFWATITAGRLLATPLSTRVSPPVMMLAVMLGCLGTCVMLAVLYFSSAALWALTAVFGSFMGPIFAASVSYPSWLGLHVTAMDTMWLVAGVAIGEMALPGAMGMVFDWSSYAALPYCVILISALQLIILLVLWKVAPVHTSLLAAAPTGAELVPTVSDASMPPVLERKASDDGFSADVGAAKLDDAGRDDTAAVVGTSQPVQLRLRHHGDAS